MLAKLKKQTSLTNIKPDLKLNIPTGKKYGHVQPNPQGESVTLDDFLRMTRKTTQDIEQRRQEDREKDLRNIENLMMLHCPNEGFPYPNI